MKTGYNKQKAVSEIIFSTENRQRFNLDRISNQDFIRYFYQTLLGRDPDPAGTATWSTSLQSHSRQEVLGLFLQNPEPRQALGFN